MKKRWVVFFTLFLAVVTAFADTVTFDKKNKGNSKDFVESDFSTLKELQNLCKKYKKNNAQVLIKAGSPFAVFTNVDGSTADFYKIFECFGVSVNPLNLPMSEGLNIGFDSRGGYYKDDFQIDFKYDGKAYVFDKISVVKPNTVSFMSVQYNEYDFNNWNTFSKKTKDPLYKQQKEEFNSMKEFEKLFKKHKSDSFYIVIPVGSKIRNESDLEQLSKILFDDSSTIKKKYMSFFNSNSTVVVESIVWEPQKSSSGDLVDALFTSIASAVSISRDTTINGESKSKFLTLEKELFDAERTANEKKGYGRLTDAEVENERKQNEAAGRGKVTNAEILRVERAANEKAGLGKLTNAEVETERSKNEAAGLGKLTNIEVEKERKANEKAGLGSITNKQAEQERNANEKAGLGKKTNAEVEKERKEIELAKNRELIKPLIDKAKAYEQKKQWTYALNAYYEAMSMNVDPAIKEEAAGYYTELADAIKKGNPGKGTYNDFVLHDEWKNLLINAEKFGTEYGRYAFTIGKLTKGALDYAKKTATYTAEIKYSESERYKNVIGVIDAGYTKAYKNDWKDLPVPSYWPEISVSGLNSKANLVDGVAVYRTSITDVPYSEYDFQLLANSLLSGKRFSQKNNIMQTALGNKSANTIYNAFYCDRAGGNEFEFNGVKCYLKSCLYDLSFNIIDNNGKEIIKPKRKLLCGGIAGYAYTTSLGIYQEVSDKINVNIVFEGISQNIMEKIDNGTAKINLLKVYLEYGNYNKADDTFATTGNERAFIKNMPELEIPLEKISVKYEE